MQINDKIRGYPGLFFTGVLLTLLALAMIVTIVTLLGVEDPTRLKQLIEDDGPVQGFGLAAITLAFSLSLWFTLSDDLRRSSYLHLSYLLLFYMLREADYHYRLSEYAKATQFKRFFLHDLIPLSHKLFLAAIVSLFLVVLYRYLRRELPGFFEALRCHLPWALCTACWAGVFFLSQAVDQLPLFHNEQGQVIEEVLEAGAEVLVLVAMLLFRIQIRGEARSSAAG